MTKTLEDQQLRDSVAQILVNYGILERERASMHFNQLVTVVVEQVPKMWTELQTQEMLRKAVQRYFQANPVSEAALIAAARSLWIRSLFGWLYNKVLATLHETDIPEIVSFNLGYHNEAQVILPKLLRTRSQADVERIVGEEFRHWFLDDLIPEEKQQRISLAAEQIWQAWQKWKREQQKKSASRSRAGKLLRAQ